MNTNKKDVATSRIVNHKPFDGLRTNGQTLQRDSYLSTGEIKGGWLPAVFIGIYFLSLWNPPILHIPDLRWYIVLGLAIFAFFAQKRALNMQAARAFWIVYGLSFLGAILSLLRARNLDQALWNTAGMGISFVTYLLFIPVLATRRARHFFMVILVGTGIAWALEIQRLLATNSVLIVTTFGETGENKNNIGLCLSMSSVALFYLSVFWKPAKTISKGWLYITRLGFGLTAIFLFYSLVIIYARSNVFATIFGIFIVVGVMIIGSRGWTDRWRIVMVVVVIVGAVMFLLPKILAVSPQWNDFSNFQNEGLGVIGTYDIRTVLIKKGLFLIGENPIIGVGLGGSRAAISYNQYSFPRFLLHNTFLADWAEKGILGLLSNVVWILMFIKILRKKFFSMPMIDQIWLILFILIFFEMNFINMSSISYMMLTILAGISAEQYYSEHLEQPSSRQRFRYTANYR